MKITSIYTKEVALLESMMSGSDRETKKYLRNMHENFVVPYVEYLNGIKRRLDEAELTPDQINQLFGSVAQQTQAAGGNETMLGKMLPDSIKKKFADSLPEPDAGEVPGFEEKATAAVQQIQDPQTKQSLMSLIKQGLQNPVTQKLIISGVQGIAGVAAGALTGGLGGKLGATAAGAITGGLVGLVAAKLQGQDWKSAAKAGLKGAAVGGAGGLIGSLASGAASSAMDAMGGGKGGDTSAMQQGINDDQQRMQAFQEKFPPGEGFTYQGAGNKLQVFDADGNKVFSGDIPFKSMDAATFAGLAQQGKNVDPTMQLGTGAQSTDIGPGSGAGSSEFAATDPRRIDQAQGGGAGHGSVNPPNVTPGQSGSTAQAVTPDTPSDGSYQQAAPLGRDGKPMQQVPMDEPAGGLDNIKPGLAAPMGADGKPMQQVPMDEPADTGTATADTGAQGGGEISADGKPYPAGLTDAQKQIYDNPIQIGSDNKGTVSFTDGTKLEAVFVPPGGIQPRFPASAQKMDFPLDGKMVQGYVVGDKVWFPNFQAGAKAESKIAKKRAIHEYVNKELTVYMWALNEQAGRRRGGVQLTEAGIGDMVKGIGSWLKTKGQNLTQNVTADKLMQAWNKAGKPTDSEKVSDIMQKAGVAPEVVNSVYQSMGIPAGAASDEKKEPTLEPEQPAQAQAPAAPEPTQAPTAQEPDQEPAQAQQTGAKDFDMKYGVPLTAAGVEKFQSLPQDQRMQSMSSAKQAGYTFDNNTGIFTPPADGAQQTAGQEAGAEQPSAAGGNIFADPKKLAASFRSYQDADGKIYPAFRGVLKDILLTALRTVESRQRKINKIVKEAKKIQGEIIAIKQQRQKL